MNAIEKNTQLDFKNTARLGAMRLSARCGIISFILCLIALAQLNLFHFESIAMALSRCQHGNRRTMAVRSLIR